MVVRTKRKKKDATKCSHVVFGVALLSAMRNIFMTPQHGVVSDNFFAGVVVQTNVGNRRKSPASAAKLSSNSTVYASLAAAGSTASSSSSTIASAVTTFDSASSLAFKSPLSDDREMLMKEALFISRERLQSRVPSWTMEFFDWQQEQLKHLTVDNWHAFGNNNDQQQEEFRFLVLKCTPSDRVCGGMTDRLKPLPLVLRMARESGRILLIRWELPHPLEEFFLPTPHFNWTVPWYMNDVLHTNGTNHRKAMDDPKFYKDMKVNRRTTKEWFAEAASRYPKILGLKLQIHDGGARTYMAEQFNTTHDETYETMYHGIFRGVFQPIPAIEMEVRKIWDFFQLTPGQYSVAHARNFYKKRDPTSISQGTIEHNSKTVVNCASRLQPGQPIFFASDSAYALQYIQDYGQQNHYPIHTIHSMQQSKKGDPLHLEAAGRRKVIPPPQDFYDAFIDLLVLGNGKCVSYGAGGYGQFASLVSFDAHCKSQKRPPQVCGDFVVA